MPLYDFRCPKCGRPYEVHVTLDEKKPVKCPVCKVKMKKELAPVMFVMK